LTKSTGLYLVALIQLIAAWSSTRKWSLTGDGVDLFLAVVSALLAVLCAIIAYRFRNSPPWPTSDPRVLRRIATVGGITGTLALGALLWRVQGEWIRLGESTSQVLAILCLLSLGYAVGAVLVLKRQNGP
jgi:hypothetical protein